MLKQKRAKNNLLRFSLLLVQMSWYGYRQQQNRKENIAFAFGEIIAFLTTI